MYLVSLLSSVLEWNQEKDKVETGCGIEKVREDMC